jgi:hypothetical protein
LIALLPVIVLAAAVGNHHWAVHLTGGKKCESKSGSSVADQAACQADADAAGHMYYSYRTDTSKCFSSASCDSPVSTSNPNFQVWTAIQNTSTTINRAKCSDDEQDHRQVKGMLACTRGQKSNLAPGDNQLECLDNLSSGQFFMWRTNGKSECTSFADEGAFSGKTQIYTPFDVQTKLSAWKKWAGEWTPDNVTAIISKMTVMHPHKTDGSVGMIAAKRIVCTNSTGSETCEVFKTGQCFKCPFQVYSSETEQDATDSEHAMFVNCCINGESKYTNQTSGDETDCPSGATGSSAFSTKNWMAVNQLDCSQDAKATHAFSNTLKAF